MDAHIKVDVAEHGTPCCLAITRTSRRGNKRTLSSPGPTGTAASRSGCSEGSRARYSRSRARCPLQPLSKDRRGVRRRRQPFCGAQTGKLRAAGRIGNEARAACLPPGPQERFFARRLGANFRGRGMAPSQTLWRLDPSQMRSIWPRTYAPAKVIPPAPAPTRMVRRTRWLAGSISETVPAKVLAMKTLSPLLLTTTP